MNWFITMCAWWKKLLWPISRLKKQLQLIGLDTVEVMNDMFLIYSWKICNIFTDAIFQLHRFGNFKSYIFYDCKGKVCMQAKWPIRLELIPVSLARSNLEYFYFVLQDGSLSIISPVPFKHLGGERNCESWVSCPRTQHNNVARARTRTARSGDERTNHEATAPPLKTSLAIEMSLKNAWTRGKLQRYQTRRSNMQITAENMQTHDLKNVAKARSLYGSTLLKISPYNTTWRALHKHEWGNKKVEWPKRERQIQCTNVTNRRSWVGLSTPFYIDNREDCIARDSLLCFARNLWRFIYPSVRYSVVGLMGSLKN